MPKQCLPGRHHLIEIPSRNPKEKWFRCSICGHVIRRKKRG